MSLKSATSSPDPTSSSSRSGPLGRPHNKSTLWDEFLEHYLPAEKYFNTKHKKAFCRRCIARAGAELTQDAAARRQFEAEAASGTGEAFSEGWEGWVYRKSFDKVDAISGRSSNMQRHIKMCANIAPDDRARIISSFEAAQPSRPQHESEERFRSTMMANVQQHFREPVAMSGPVDGRRFTAVNALAAPPQPQHPEQRQILQRPTMPVPMQMQMKTQAQTQAQTGEASGSGRPEVARQSNASPKLSLKNILNSSDTPIPAARPRTFTPATLNPQPAPLPSIRYGDPAVISRLDAAINELTALRASLNPPPPSPQLDSAAHTRITMNCLRDELAVLRREHEWLKVRYMAAKEQIERYETNSMLAYRANSAPALCSPVSEGEGAKKRKFEHEETGGPRRGTQ
ncbi:hypothetical protein EDC01DRAFT_658535 [Geopyxis carbonaria]|nr:hypothetical protein EDC01DRAFT_658535 [Geopyxis carbonaria]